MRVFSRRWAVLALLAGGVAMAAGLTASPVAARTVVSVGIGGGPGWYGPPPPYYYAPPPPVYYYPPPPVYVAPPTTIVVPAPAPAVQGPAPAATWYYCDDPKGYYPYVANCNTGWRPVQPTTPQQ
ncbi:hypothetical protein [Telmatospirillum siberiense]|uniref:Lipoprotein n=1 Tax=Telmatospirillum siberiense TaxID=382514 RepID=A0A2N3PMF6_9PROT|nr:hypothetical protein [Telmatospirillum siberiense]PKU21589.1 hypothetical protein CWS72_25885 [Telmatospirillum siberiense]